MTFNQTNDNVYGYETYTTEERVYIEMQICTNLHGVGCVSLTYIKGILQSVRGSLHLLT